MNRGMIRCGNKNMDNNYYTISITGNSEYNIFMPNRLGPFRLIEKPDPNVNVEIGNNVSILRNGDHQLYIINFSQWWSFSKIYRTEIKEGRIVDDFFKKRNKGFVDANSTKKLSSEYIGTYQNGVVLDRLHSLKYYIFIYKQLVEKHKVFIQLKQILYNGSNLFISGPTGVDIGPINKENILNLYFSNPEIFSHELILAAILSDSLPDEFYENQPKA